jgi:hypothetical protein
MIRYGVDGVLEKIETKDWVHTFLEAHRVNAELDK